MNEVVLTSDGGGAGWKKRYNSHTLILFGQVLKNKKKRKKYKINK